MDEPAHAASFRVQALEKVAALMTAAFGLVAALAWNDAIKALIGRYVTGGDALGAQVVYALIVTVLAVLVSLWIASAVARARRRAEGSRPDDPTPEA